MNGIEKITRRIDTDAQAEIDGLLAAARAEAEGIEAKYRSQAEREAASLQARNEKAAAEREERLVSVTQMEARKVLLGAKQETVEAAFAKALEVLCALPEERYAEVAADLMVKAAPDGMGEVIFSARDRERIGVTAVSKANERLGAIGHLTLSQETRPIQGGLILKNGSVEVNCTFETLVRLHKGEMAGEVAKRLFPGA